MGKIVASDFRPAWWLPGPHLQTQWPSFARRRSTPPLNKLRLELADGDFIDLAVAGNGPKRVLVIHGLEGNLESHYAGSMVTALVDAGFQAIFMHLRGCSGEPNRLDRAYHSGASDDLAAVLEYLELNQGDPPAAAIGYSIGGNLLLKYLGETEHARLQAAIAVSVPFVLRDAALRMNIGASRIYRRYLIDKLKLGYRTKFASRPSPLWVDLNRIYDFFAFDERITAPLCGFDGVEDYYARCSSRQFLRNIDTPTLILHARDDPFMFTETIPTEGELGPGVTLELAEHGGHVGFVSGPCPWRPVYWLEGRILRFLARIDVPTPLVTNHG